MAEKIGIKETKEVFAFAKGIVGDLAKNMADDGKISTAEWLSIAMGNAPAAVSAMMGMDRIDDELKDLDEAEVRELAALGLDLVKILVDAFQGKKG